MNNKSLLVATLVTSAVSLAATVIFGLSKTKCKWQTEKINSDIEGNEKGCNDENN